MKPFDQNKLYVVDGKFITYVQSVMERMYRHDSQRINADESRTMANGLNAHLSQNVEEWKEK